MTLLFAALIFIDKYTQVPRILKPIVQCVARLPALVEDAAFHSYVRGEWGSVEDLRLQILSDLFKHGFDGSGVNVFLIFNSTQLASSSTTVANWQEMTEVRASMDA